MPVNLKNTSISITPSSDGKLYGNNPDGDTVVTPSDWPAYGAHAEFGMFNRANVDFLADPVLLDAFAEKDGFVFQSSYLTNSWLNARYSTFSDLKAVNPNLKLVAYIFPYGIDKTPSLNGFQRWQDELIRGGRGNLDWFLTNAAGAQVQHKGDVWASNMADQFVPLNAFGETYAEAYWRELFSDLSTIGDNSFFDVIDGVYLDVARLRPPPQSPTDGDYNYDGTNDSRAGDGIGFWSDGHVQWMEKFAETGFPSDFAMIGNGGTDGFEYDQGVMPLPLNALSVYGKWHARQAEESALQWGIDTDGAGGYIIGVNNPDSAFRTRIRREFISEKMIIEDPQHPWGKGFVWFEGSGANATAGEDDYHWMRSNAAFCRGFEKVMYACSLAGKRPPPRLDEHKVIPGNPLPSWQSWGTLDENDATHQIRPPDYENGGVQVYFFPYENVLWMMRRDQPGATGTSWPNGTAATVPLPDPGAGYHYEYVDGTQDPVVNPGGNVTGSGFGEVTLRPWQGRMVLRVPD